MLHSVSCAVTIFAIPNEQFVDRPMFVYGGGGGAAARAPDAASARTQAVTASIALLNIFARGDLYWARKSDAPGKRAIFFGVVIYI